MGNSSLGKLNKVRAAGIIFLIIAILGVIAGSRQKHISPFSTVFECDDVVYHAEDENGGAMVERTYQTIYFYNASHQIVAVTNMSAEGEGTSLITELGIEDGEILIYEAKLLSGSVYLESESIQAYNHKGQWIREVCHVEYDAADCVTKPQLADGEYDVFSDNLTISSMTLTYSIGFLIRNLFYWLCIVFFAVGFTLLLVDLLLNKTLIRHRIAILIGMTFLLTIGFYSLNTYQMIFSFYRDTVSTASKQICILLDSGYAEEINQIIETGDIQGYLTDEANQKTLLAQQQKFSAFLNANSSDYNYFATVFILDPENDADDLYAEGNNIYSFMDSRSLIDTGKKIDYTGIKNSYSSKKYGDVNVVRNGINSSMFSLKIVRDADGTPIAVVRVVAHLSNIIASETKTIENALVNLFAIYIFIYVFYILLGKYIRDIRKMVKRAKDDSCGRALDMSGIYMFFFQIANTIDEVILVYVAKSICSDPDPAIDAIMIALTFSSLGAGRWIGTFLSGSVIQAFGERKVGALSSLFGVGTMLLMTFSVVSSNIYLLIVGKFLQGFFLSGCLFVIADTMPLNSNDPNARQDALNHSRMSMIGAELLVALAGGYISEYIGFSVVYLMGAFVCALIFVLTILVFGKSNSRAAVNKQSIANIGKHWAIFFKKPMLLFLIFYMIPYTLIGGYKTYIFPLFTANAGISVLLLSNISVYGKALTFALDDPLKKFSEKVKAETSMVLPVLIFSGCMVYFWFSSNVNWAIMLYFAVSLIRRVTSVGQRLYIAKISEQYNEDVKLVQSNFYTIESAINVPQSPVLSAFLSIGLNAGSALVGAVSFMMVGIFEILCQGRKRLFPQSSQDNKSV